MSSRIHPTDNYNHNLLLRKEYHHHHHHPSVLTVWKRSSMSFQGTDGFTVFDPQGRLVFRVDNYSRKNRYVARTGLLLMDGIGNALLTLKPQITSMKYQWNAYIGEENPKIKVFSMRSPSSVFHTGKDVAEIFMGGPTMRGQKPDFRIDGSFKTRDCNVSDATGVVVAKMARKRITTTILLSQDVFSLVVQPGFDTQLIMAFLVILDRMCGKPFAPLLCS